MSTVTDTIARQVSLALRQNFRNPSNYKFWKLDDNTLRIDNKSNSHKVEVRYMPGSDTYDLKVHTLRKQKHAFDVVKTEEFTNVYWDSFRNFFNR